jgi:hypothetical protein
MREGRKEGSDISGRGVTNVRIHYNEEERAKSGVVYLK